MGDLIVNMCTGFARKNHMQSISGSGHFLTGIKNFSIEYCIEKATKNYVRYYRPHFSYRFFKNFVKVNTFNVFVTKK